MSKKADGLPRRVLGRLGREVVTLGLGGAWLGHFPEKDPEEQDAIAVAAVHRAIELGLDYLDTAPLYGESERRVGLALSQAHPNGGTWRDRVFLVTKTGTHPARRRDYSAAATRWTVENSLKQLRTDRFDAVLVHDPTDMGPVLATGGAAEELVRLKNEGIIGGIGIGVAGHAHLLAATADGRFDLIQTTYDYTLIRTSALETVIPTAYAHNLGIINASPFHSGLLAIAADLDDFTQLPANRWEAPDVERARLLWEWARVRDLDLCALALQFSFREPRFAMTLVGPRDTAEVERNVRAATTQIPDAAWDELSALLPTLPTPSPGGERTDNR